MKYFQKTRKDIDILSLSHEIRLRKGERQTDQLGDRQSVIGRQRTAPGDVKGDVKGDVFNGFPRFSYARRAPPWPPRAVYGNRDAGRLDPSNGILAARLPRRYRVAAASVKAARISRKILGAQLSSWRPWREKRGLANFPMGRESRRRFDLSRGPEPPRISIVKGSSLPLTLVELQLSQEQTPLQRQVPS